MRRLHSYNELLLKFLTYWRQVARWCNKAIKKKFELLFTKYYNKDYSNIQKDF